MSDADVGRVLREARVALGLSQLAFAARIRRTQGWVCRVEQGTVALPLDALGVWARALGLTAEDVLERAQHVACVPARPATRPTPAELVPCRNCGALHRPRRDQRRLCQACVDHQRRYGYARGQHRPITSVRGKS